MSTKINILPDFIANQIAAGEVVQRPESVVKELVENSLDAGAESVFVMVKNAGKSLIHIVDDGSGMSRDDLELSVKRHATSKVFTQEDLESIKTFGFRGEALASVCSVANIEIRTKQPEEKHGWKLLSEPMRPPRIDPFNSDDGTQIFVRNLFYNVPARRKFLKSNLTEFRHISDTMLKFAIGNPGKRFTFYDDDSLIFDVKPQELRRRISDALGGDFRDSLIPVDFSNDIVKITGYLGEPHMARQVRSNQYLFLNKRPIISNSLSYSVYTAFEHLIEKNYKPVFILNLEIDHRKVDINVHPQKHEVKFEDERYIFNSVKNATMEALSAVNLSSNINLESAFSIDPLGKVPLGGGEQILVNKSTGEIIGHRNEINFDYPPPNSFERPSGAEISAFDSLFSPKNRKDEPIESPDGGRIISIFGKYILAEYPERLLIINRTAAQRRIIYERLLNSWENNSVKSQEMLFPEKIEIDSGKISKAGENKEILSAGGFDFEIRDNAIFLNAVPAVVTDGKEKVIFEEIVSELPENQNPDSRKAVEMAFIIISRAGANALSPNLSFDEQLRLVRDLMNCRINNICPEGGRIIKKLSKQDFDNFFNKT